MTGGAKAAIAHLIKIASRSTCAMCVRPHLSMRHSCVPPVLEGRAGMTHPPVRKNPDFEDGAVEQAGRLIY
jgi:hypothetical protein